MMTSAALVPLIGIAVIGAVLWLLLPLVRLLCGLAALGTTVLVTLAVLAPSTRAAVSPSLLRAATWITSVGAEALRAILGGPA